MNEATLSERLKRTLYGCLRLPTKYVTQETLDELRLVSLIGWNDENAIRLSLCIKRDFHVHVPYEDIMSCETFNGLLDVVGEAVKKRIETLAMGSEMIE